MPRPLGSVSAVTPVVCSAVNGWAGVPNKTCTELTISVPGLADIVCVIGVNQPVGSPLGTVVFLTGGGAPAPYDSIFAHGADVVNALIAYGFVTVQLFFPFAPVGSHSNAGWITTNQGILAAAARVATALNYIKQYVAIPGLPFIGVGNSGGSSAIVYAMGDYGILFDAVELCSGPTYTAIDQGCGVTPAQSLAPPCGQGSQTTTWVHNTQVQDGDPAYGVSAACSLHNASVLARFQADSILRSDTVVSFPNTDINMVLGGLDASSAVAQAMLWFQAMNPTGSKSLVCKCVPLGTHGLPDTTDGANQIIADVEAFA